MQQNYKLNGYTVNQFATLTKIEAHNVYRYLKQGQGDTQKTLSKAFSHKYGNDIDRYKAFHDYYLTEFIKIRNVKIGSAIFWQLKNDFNDSAAVFRLRESRVDDIWNDIMRNTYYRFENYQAYKFIY